MLTVETPLGIMRATRADYPGHPGIRIELQRAGEDDFLPLALVEYADDEADLPENVGFIISRAWQDIKEDEYSDRVVHKNVRVNSLDIRREEGRDEDSTGVFT